jgi:hypothetical protein
MTRTLGRVFAVVWCALAVLGALNGGIAERWLGHRVNLLLPHLQQAEVMFIEIPRAPQVHWFVGADGQRRSVADLLEAPALLYARARVEANLSLNPDLLDTICRRHIARGGAPVDITTDDYRLNFRPERPYRSITERCDDGGLRRIR